MNHINFNLKDYGSGYITGDTASNPMYFSVETFNDGSALVEFRCYDSANEKIFSVKKRVKPNDIECFFFDTFPVANKMV